MELKKIKPGPVEKPIDWNKVEQLLIAGCKGTEIAPHFNMHSETFYERVYKHYGKLFTQIAGELYEKGDSILRAKQYEKAVKGDNTLLIWLGKNRLKQRDKDVAEQTDEIKLLREYLAEIRLANKGLPGDSRPEVAVEQPLLDKGLARQEGEIQTELGTAGTSE